jgi:small subunit ribosomal protein S6
MQREYELVYIVRPDLDEDAVRAAQESVEKLIGERDGEVVKTNVWGKRRLAYEVQKMRDGHYVLLNIRLDSTRVADLERALRIHDTVFRHMLVSQDESLADEPGDRPATATPAVAVAETEAEPVDEMEDAVEDDDEPAMAGAATGGEEV